jgi:hypothetical protein
MHAAGNLSTAESRRRESVCGRKRLILITTPTTHHLTRVPLFTWTWTLEAQKNVCQRDFSSASYRKLASAKMTKWGTLLKADFDLLYFYSHCG